MNFLWDKVTEWLKELLIGSIMSNLTGLFDNVNRQVAGIADNVGATPQAWNGGVFGMIRNLSDNVILPIAGVILALVATLELIQMIVDRNNMHDMDTFMLAKWVFKTACAVVIVTNTWNIVMAVFDVAQSVVSRASGLVIADTDIRIDSVIVGLEAKLAGMELGALFGLWVQSMFVGFTMWALAICIFIITYGRMIEIYLVTSVAPIPMATMVNREWGADGAELSAKPFCAGLSGVSHHHLRGDLCHTGARHCGGERRIHGDLDVHGVHGAAVLYAV